MLTEIRDMHEKQMVIARQIIKRKNRGEDYREDDVPHLWGNYFPGDIKMKDVKKDVLESCSGLWQECFSWINNYVKGHTLDECDKDLDRLRHQQERTLKNACKHTRYKAKMFRQDKNRLAGYCVLRKGGCKSGSFEGVMWYIKQVKD